MAALVDARVRERRATADQLALAARWADLHPVVAGEPAAGWGEVTLAGEQLVPLAGEGAPQVAEFAPEELAVALDMCPDAARQLLADALELRHRLPRLWERVGELAVPSWKARHLARQTVSFTSATAAQVDVALAQVVDLATRSLTWLEDRVRTVRDRCHPEDAGLEEQRALQSRGVWLDHRHSTATTRISITADTLDALAFDGTITDLARQLKALGDTDDLDVRRARGIGLLADPQAALDLLDGTDPDSNTDTAPARAGSPGRSMELLVHLDPGSDIASVDRLGPATKDLIADWLTTPDRVTVRPVINLNRTDAVDRHDPPPWMRELVVLRDPECIFPGCHRTSRVCDLDHIVPFDDTGPPGQTNPANLAPLCRRHHRLKTHTRWGYRRRQDGSYEWTTPHGETA